MGGWMAGCTCWVCEQLSTWGVRGRAMRGSRLAQPAPIARSACWVCEQLREPKRIEPSTTGAKPVSEKCRLLKSKISDDPGFSSMHEAWRQASQDQPTSHMSDARRLTSRALTPPPPRFETSTPTIEGGSVYLFSKPLLSRQPSMRSAPWIKPTLFPSKSWRTRTTGSSGSETRSSEAGAPSCATANAPNTACREASGSESKAAVEVVAELADIAKQVGRRRKCEAAATSACASQEGCNTIAATIAKTYLTLCQAPSIHVRRDDRENPTQGFTIATAIVKTQRFVNQLVFTFAAAIVNTWCLTDSYMHLVIHTYIHPCVVLMRTYILTCMQSPKLTYLHTPIHPSIHTCVHSQVEATTMRCFNQTFEIQSSAPDLGWLFIATPLLQLFSGNEVHTRHLGYRGDLPAA